jgi:hypothetical protein
MALARSDAITAMLPARCRDGTLARHHGPAPCCQPVSCWQRMSGVVIISGDAAQAVGPARRRPDGGIGMLARHQYYGNRDSRLSRNWPARGRQMTGVVMVTPSARRRRRRVVMAARLHAITVSPLECQY